MNFLILHSSEDKASMNILERFQETEQYRFQEIDVSIQNNKIFELIDLKNSLLDTTHIFLALVDESLIYLKELKFNNIDFNPDLLIFASRHRSKTARPAFLVHSTGNWTSDTKFGGEAYQLSNTSALMIKAGLSAFLKLFECSNFSKFNIDLEVTHHGPTALTTPLIFMELGSSEDEWSIQEAGRLVSEAIIGAILKFIEFNEEGNQKVGLGFGGTHYAPNFNRLITNNDIALSFICPKYFITNLNEMMINQMINNTYEHVDYFIIDWKGTSSDDKKHLIPLLESYNLPIMKTKDFKISK
ncbi:MAG: D-aminoacyl-tRNA deacylase [Candidatus Thorarchaeota archaeon]